MWWIFRHGASKLAVAGAALAVACGGAELLWRQLRANRFGPATNPSYVLYDDLLGWRYRANASTRHRTAAFDVAVEIDRAGRRVGRDCGAPADRKSSARIAFLGDSMTFGWGVEADQAYPCLVARALDAQAVNLAVAGYATDQESLVFDAQVAAEGAGAVVLQLCRNDLAEVLAGVRWGRPKPLVRVLPDGTLEVSPARDRALFLDTHSALVPSLRSLVDRGLRRPPTPAQEAAGVELITALIDRMARRSAALGASFVLLTDRVGWLDPSFLPAHGVRIEVGPNLAAAAARGEQVVLSGEAHWSAHAHRLFADELVRALRAEARP